MGEGVSGDRGPEVGREPAAVSAVGHRAGAADQAAGVRRGADAVGRAAAARGERRPQTGAADEDVAEVLEALASDARTRIASVRDGLRSILKLLSSAPGTVVVVDDYRLEPPASMVKGARSGDGRAIEDAVGRRSAAGARKPRLPRSATSARVRRTAAMTGCRSRFRGPCSSRSVSPNYEPEP